MTVDRSGLPYLGFLLLIAGPAVVDAVALVRDDTTTATVTAASMMLVAASMAADTASRT